MIPSTDFRRLRDYLKRISMTFNTTQSYELQYSICHRHRSIYRSIPVKMCLSFKRSSFMHAHVYKHECTAYDHGGNNLTKWKWKLKCLWNGKSKSRIVSRKSVPMENIVYGYKNLLFCKTLACFGAKVLKHFKICAPK